VFREYCARIRVNLALPSDAHAGALEAEIKPADAGKQ
jgi:hypothetical protein